MAKKSLTKDEAFLCALAKTARQQEDLFSSVDMYEIGRIIGQNSRSVDNIVRMLAQANFIKKEGNQKIFLTKNGETLVNSLESQ